MFSLGMYTYVMWLTHSLYLARIARISRRGITWMLKMYVCMHNHVRLGGCGGMLPQEIIIFLHALRLGQKQSRMNIM